MKKHLIFLLLLFCTFSLHAQLYRDQFLGGYRVWNASTNQYSNIWVLPFSTDTSSLFIVNELCNGWDGIVDSLQAERMIDGCPFIYLNYHQKPSYSTIHPCILPPESQAIYIFFDPDSVIPNFYSQALGYGYSSVYTRFYKPVSNEPHAVFPVQVYPNPVNEKLRLSIPPIPVFVEIYNMAGQILKTFRTQGAENELDVSELPSGMYWLRVQSPAGMVCKSFVKE